MNAKLRCPKCEVSYEIDHVESINVGGKTVGYMCPQCRGPCFEEESEPPADSQKQKTASKPEDPLLQSKPRPAWMKWALAIAILLGTVLYIFPHFYLYLRGEKSREKQKKIIEEWSQSDNQDKDLFDKYEVVMDRDTF